MNRPGHSTPVTNLSYCVRRNAYRPVRYHSGTVMPGGTVGWNLNPRSIGNTPPVMRIAPEIAMTMGTSNTRNRGKVDRHEPEHDQGQYEDVLGIEAEHKVVEPSAEHGVAYGRPYHRNGVGQGRGYADGKLGPLAEYDVVPRERLEYGHGPEYDARNPQDLVADLVAPAKVLVGTCGVWPRAPLRSSRGSVCCVCGSRTAPRR